MLLERSPRLRIGQRYKLSGEPPADLKVLIVDSAGPVAAPLRKAMMGEHVDHRLGHAGALILPPDVAAAGGRAHLDPACAPLDIGILDRIEIDRQAVGMQRHRVGALDAADVECRRVVARHRGVVAATIVIHQLGTGDGERPASQRDEDRKHVVRHRVEHHQLAVIMGGAVESHVAEPHQPQAFAADRRAGIEDLRRPHVAAKRVRNRRNVSCADDGVPFARAATCCRTRTRAGERGRRIRGRSRAVTATRT